MVIKKSLLLLNILAGFDGFILENFHLRRGYPLPTSLGYIASYLLQHRGYRANKINCAYYDFPYYLKKYKPTHIGISVNISQYKAMLKIVKYIKRTNPKIKIILGGYIPTFCYKEIFKELNNLVDVIVIGEGEQTFLELYDHFFKQKLSLEEVKGIAFLKKGKIIITPPRPFIKNLDELPYPIRDYRKKAASILTSRGCPFSCKFCSIKNFYHGTFRRRSVENVIDELKFLKKKALNWLTY